MTCQGRTHSTKILHADCRDALACVAPNSVQCVVTSPPYWGLRDYGHEAQLGLEATPAEYLERMVDVFRLVRRALREDGTLWLNMGDSYITRRCGVVGENSTINGTKTQAQSRVAHASRSLDRAATALPYKSLVGMPWRLALALQEDGWLLRSDIIWHKPNPMPESVRDRPTTAHEHVFLLAKSERYYFAADAIAEPTTGNAHGRGAGVNPKADGRIPRGWDTGPGDHRGLRGNYTPKNEASTRLGRGPGWRSKQNASFSSAVTGLVDQRNARTVWTMSTQPYDGAHFATFPEELARRCILAGTKPGDLVLDPFAGSGTVGVVASRFERRALLIEASAEYCAFAIARCEKSLRDYALPLYSKMPAVTASALGVVS